MGNILCLWREAVQYDRQLYDKLIGEVERKRNLLPLWKPAKLSWHIARPCQPRDSASLIVARSYEYLDQLIGIPLKSGRGWEIRSSMIEEHQGRRANACVALHIIAAVRSGRSREQIEIQIRFPAEGRNAVCIDGTPSDQFPL